MRPLAFNTALQNAMRPKYQLALAILPVGLLFASFAPLIFWSFRLGCALGIHPNDAVKSHPNGLRWFTAFMTGMVLGMIAGYLVGWLLNALVSRYVLGWSAATVAAVYLRSEVPGHWLKDGESARAPSSSSLAKWESQRSAGLFAFVLRRGVLAWGAPMFVALYLIPAVNRGAPITTADMLFHLALWGVAGGVFGTGLWYFLEWRYRRESANKESSARHV